MLPAGRRLTARDIGLAAAANHPWLAVHRRPRVGILATGDEIALPGDPIPPGGIVSSNAHALAALVRAAGGEPLVLPIAPDDRDAIAAAAAAAPRLRPAGDHRRRQRRRARPGAERAGAGGLRAGFLEDRHAAGQAADLGAARADAGARPAGQSGLGAGLRRACSCCRRWRVLSGLPAGAAPHGAGRAGAALAANDRRFDHLRARLLGDGSDGRLVATPSRSRIPRCSATLARADALILRAPHAPAAAGGRGGGGDPARRISASDGATRAGLLWKRFDGDAENLPRTSRVIPRLFQAVWANCRGRCGQGTGVLREVRHAHAQAARTAHVHRPAPADDRLLALLRGDEGGAEPASPSRASTA